jgi:transcriptional regulator with XRE-family HTH domain
MGKASREKPIRLAEKLLKIRNALGLSQSEMLKALGIADRGYRNYISDFELGKREPPLLVLLKYAELANVWLDVIVNDELDLPEKFPSVKKHEGIKRAIRRRKQYQI